MSVYCKGQSWSLCGLVCPRMEEQISGAISLWEFKRPSISGWEGPSCSPKYSKLCYDQFGVTLEASNPPHLFNGRLPPSYWADLGRCCCSCFFTSISWPNSFSISFWTNHICAGEWELDQWHCICFLPTPAGKTMEWKKLRRIFC